ncbi:hypothetical protein COOONC_12454 [Cooperia oncophora]
MKSHEVSQWEATIKHEIIHAFVFTPALWKNFPGAGNAVREEDMTIIPNVVHKITRSDWESSKGVMKHDVYMVVTPKVREEARRFLNCSTIEGAELENQGGGGTAGSHWEKRVFENEAMTGIATQVYALSRLTLALFEDSGWYKVNYDKAEDMTWGRNLGCTFAKQSCLTWIKRNLVNPYPFCTMYDDQRCSTTRKAKLSCGMTVDRKTVPDEYNYNVRGLYRDKKNKEVVGYGTIYAADFCPYYRVSPQMPSSPFRSYHHF